MEIAALEIARMSEEIDGLRSELLCEQQARMELEAHLESQRDREQEIEQVVREECYLEMEGSMHAELARWKAVWAAETERGEAHLDRKLEIYTRSIDCAVLDDEDKENASMNQGLEMENQRLKREVEMLKRDLAGRSPSKGQRMPLRESRMHSQTGHRAGDENEDGNEVGDMGRSMQSLSMNGNGSGRGSRVSLKGGASLSGSPTKKVRKLTARKWDLGEGEML